MNRTDSIADIAYDYATAHSEAPVPHRIGAEQLLPARVGDLKVIIAVRQTCGMCGSVRAGATVEVDRAGGIILIAVDYSATAVGRKNRAAQAGSKRGNAAK